MSASALPPFSWQLALCVCAAFWRNKEYKPFLLARYTAAVLKTLPKDCHLSMSPR